jgi:L-fuconate dehydratase
MIDFVVVSGSWDGRVCEFVDHLHEHFTDPCRIQRGRYLAPQQPGYSTEMKRASREKFQWPGGEAWQIPPA